MLVSANVQHTHRVLSQRALPRTQLGRQHVRVMPDDLPALVEVAPAHGLRSPAFGE